MDMYNTNHFYDGLQVLEREDAPLERMERLRAVEKPLLSWYASRARSLPWRDEPLPYRVWISEIMLQQTRVEAVKPYFERFMEAFPTVLALAEAEDDHLMKMWEGLGYYNRARNLKKAAQILRDGYGGCLPASFDELIKLPGIGSYTAGAIASIAFNIPMPAVDGNVLRVISRLLGDREDIRKASVKARMESELRRVMPEDNASRYNQGLIEIGALVCIPGGEPKCGGCPLASICLTGRNGWWREIPHKSPQKKRRIEERTVFVIEYQDKVAIHKRPPRGLLASLYELPNIEGRPGPGKIPSALGLKEEQVESVAALPASKHIFSHVEWHMTGYRVVLKPSGEEPVPLLPENGRETGPQSDPGREGAHASLNWFFVTREEVAGTYPLPNAFNPYTKLIG